MLYSINASNLVNREVGIKKYKNSTVVKAGTISFHGFR